MVTFAVKTNPWTIIEDGSITSGKATFQSSFGNHDAFTLQHSINSELVTAVGTPSQFRTQSVARYSVNPLPEQTSLVTWMGLAVFGALARGWRRKRKPASATS